MFLKMTATTVDVGDLPVPKDWTIEANVDCHFLMTRAVVLAEDDIDPDGLRFRSGSIHGQVAPSLVHAFEPGISFF